MGIKNSPDIFQAIMADLLGDLDFARAYIDDILIISNGSFQDHLDKIKQVLQGYNMLVFVLMYENASLPKQN